VLDKYSKDACSVLGIIIYHIPYAIAVCGGVGEGLTHTAGRRAGGVLRSLFSGGAASHSSEDSSPFRLIYRLVDR